jgi:peptidoglycan/LPS O-acetylase OafA/YrhL
VVSLPLTRWLQHPAVPFFWGGPEEVYYGVRGLVPGVLMGLAQAPLLRARTRHPAFWVAGSGAGWALAVAAGYLLSFSNLPRGPFEFLPLSLLGAFLVGGILTGIALVLLLHQQPSSTAREPRAS